MEGVFELPDAVREALGERLAEDAEELVLARRVGRRAVRGHISAGAARRRDLRDPAPALLSFYGQHESAS